MKGLLKILFLSFSMVIILAVITCLVLAVYPIIGSIYYTHRLERSVQDNWRSFDKWSTLDAAIKLYGREQPDFDAQHLQVPLSGKVSYYVISNDAICVEYGGGFLHFGILYYLDQHAFENALRNDPDNHKLNEKLIYYSEHH